MIRTKYRRIISLAPSNTEILYALGLEESIVGVTRFCDFPNDANSKKMVGGWIDVNDDLVNSLHPDLILTSTFVQDDITKRYQDSDLNIVAVRPKTLDEVYDSIFQIGQLTGREDQATILIEKMVNQFDEIQDSLQYATTKPRLYIEEWHKPPTVSGNWVPDIVAMAQTDYPLIKSGVYSTAVTTEQLIEFDPEYIILSWCGFADQASIETVKKRPGYDKLTAVKNNNIFVFNDSLLNRPGPRLVEALRLLVKTVHPEV